MTDMNEASKNISSAEGSINNDAENSKKIIEIYEAVENHTDDYEEDNPFCRKKRNRTSKVWNEFNEVLAKDGSMKAKCIHCKYQLTKPISGPTTQFRRHLDRCQARPKNLKGQKQLSVLSTIAETETMGAVQNFKYDQANIREVVSHMIMVHELPFIFVEYELFNLLMRNATPNYQMISRATVRKDCFSSYELEKKKIVSLLKNVNRVSIITDLWKSNNQKISYMVVTCHFVDCDWNLQKRILNFVDIPPPHTGVCICDVLHKCLIEWGIEDKVCTVSVDNASSNDVAIRLLKETLSYKNKLPLGGKLFHVRCCAHIINLLLQDGLSVIIDIIKNVRESVKYVVNSEACLNMFTEIAKQLKLPTKRLILDCCRRWNATYFMLSAALEFKDVFPRFQQRDPNYVCLPSEEDWRRVDVVCSYLEEFHEVTKIILGSEYPTSNLFLTELYGIKKLFNNFFLLEDDFMKAMVNNMIEKFDKYWGNSNLLISIAAVLDPRNRMQMIEWCFSIIYLESEASRHILIVLETLRMLYKEYLEACRPNNVEVSGNEYRKEGSSNLCVIGKGKSRGRDDFKNYIRSNEMILE